MKVAGIYLAAGQNRRPAARTSMPAIRENTSGSAAVSELERCGLEPLVVVVRAGDRLEWLPTGREQGNVRTETCLTAHLGLSFSLRCGLNAVLPLQPDAVIIAQADQPYITASIVSRLMETFERSPELDYVSSAAEGAGMPTALYSKVMFPALAEMDDDGGAAGILHSADYKGVVLPVVSPMGFWEEGICKDTREFTALWSERNIK
ncbi:NTP transferase domain-containing protein [Paenibacillus donghaensis]|uniref:NTP transferase domain-containing protein n=1 Tax=Paenibacillus donghaensis TaxID=414771 RepID=UPI0012FB2C32|nr:NTP transferase domain-containing protein [Paenibacillus donghaensis]